MTSAVKVECIDCAALPHSVVAPNTPGSLYRPAKPRPIDSRATPRRPRCTTHWRAWDKTRRLTSRAKRAADNYGLTPDDRAALIALQGGVDPISGRGLDHDGRGRLRNTNTDHDHTCCPKPPTCGQCTRGLLDGYTNRELIARLEQMPGGGLAAAHRLVAYFTDPPYRQLLRTRQEN